MAIFVYAMNVLSGMVLLVEMWRTIPRIGDLLDRFVRSFATFEAAIGILAITAGVLEFSGAGVLAIFAGLALGWSFFANIPALGPSLEGFGKTLRGFQTILGFASLIVGVVGLL